MLLKRLLHKIFARNPFIAVPAAYSADGYEVTFEGPGSSIPLTGKHSLVALDPLLIAITLQQDTDLHKGQLVIRNKNKLLGRLNVELTETIVAGTTLTGMYKVNAYHNAVLNPLNMFANGLYLFLQNRSNLKLHNLIMPVRVQHQLHVYYLHPRPVVLITAGQKDSLDLFPMDNIGYADERTFLLGLRKTNAALYKLEPGADVCISFVPFEHKKDVYALGTHHVNGTIDPANLGFELVHSPAGVLPVPAFALKVIEGKISHKKLCGSHELLHVSVMNEFIMNEGTGLAHTPWFMKKRSVIV